MEKNNHLQCDEKDALHHYLEEQIAYIAVQEEEERMREELEEGTELR